MAVAVLDAGVVIALRDFRDAHHAAAVDALADLRRWALVLPASAYAEMLVEPSEAGAHAVRAARRILDAVPIAVEPVTREIAERAAVLRRHVRLPDALVLATGDVLDADVVLTTDQRWQGISRRVRVIS